MQLNSEEWKSSRNDNPLPDVHVLKRLMIVRKNRDLKQNKYEQIKSELNEYIERMRKRYPTKKNNRQRERMIERER